MNDPLYGSFQGDMIKKLLLTYKIQNRVKKVAVFFCLCIMSGCGGGMNVDGYGNAGAGDTGTSIGEDVPGDTEELTGGHHEEAVRGGQNEVVPADFITLSWMAPMSNADGTCLTDLSGYMIYYREAYAEAETFSIDAGDETSVTIEHLSPGTWCFTVTAYNSLGRESNFSNYACKDI